MDIKDYADSIGDSDKAAAAEKAKALASSLSEAEIEAIKKCAAKAGSVNELFSDPEFRRIIGRRGGDGE
ncbi:MAG: hypothetical protein J5441_04825 [Clostridia bacterium]|nr:hypothetical protein [Clostridia bacterium]